jgi:predicted DCC family thiol-disulfide oxidoreductase YuxK
VQFIIKRDANEKFSFASLQSEIGQALIKKYNVEKFDSIVLIKNEKVYIYSDAVLHIAKELGAPTKYIYYARFIPKFSRDLIYKFIAKYRYILFGKKNNCMIPTSDISRRFLK